MGRLADDVADAESGIESDREKVLQDGGEKNGIAVVDERVGAVAFATAEEAVFLGDVIRVDPPEDLGAFGFLGGGTAA